VDYFRHGHVIGDVNIATFNLRNFSIHPRLTLFL